MPVPFHNPELESTYLSWDTYVSEEIWEKFGFENTKLKYLSDYLVKGSTSPVYDECFTTENPVNRNKKEFSSYKRLCAMRNHDCMWAGLCISKAHNGFFCTKTNTDGQGKINPPAGRSVLISRSLMTSSHLCPHQKLQQQQQTLQKSQYYSYCNLYLNDHSNYNSNEENLKPYSSYRCCTPPTDLDTEDEYHCIYEIGDKKMLPRCKTKLMRAVPVSAVTGQSVRSYETPKEEKVEKEEIKEQEEEKEELTAQANLKTTLSDHSYHLNHPDHQRIENLGIQTPSESEEEEIDVVSYDRPSRVNNYLLLKDELKERQFNQERLEEFAILEQSIKDRRNRRNTTSITRTTTITTTTSPTQRTPKPRGRPPASAKRKRKVDTNKTAIDKRKTRKTVKRRKTRNNKNGGAALSSEDEANTEKRSLHNDMERLRRIELRNSFELLRGMVPAVMDKEKCAKVLILKTAAAYCKQLTNKTIDLEAEKERLAKRQDQLKENLRLLRLEAHMARSH